MLTRDQAKELVLSRLKVRQGPRDFSIAEDRTIEHEFGWLFYVTISESVTTEPRLIIVNKHVGQVIESSIKYTPERFIEIYETLLTKSQASGGNWCSTVSLPFLWRDFKRRRLAKKAREMGLYEIR